MSNVELANRLLRLKKEIKENEDEEIRIKAKLESAMELLNAKTITKAKEELLEIQKKITAMEKELEEDASELEDKYEI